MRIKKTNLKSLVNSITLTALFTAFCLFLGGCGADAASADTAQQTDQQAEEGTEENLVSAESENDGVSDNPTEETADIETNPSASTLSSPYGSIPKPSVSLPEEHSGEIRTVVGIITDASKDSVAIQTPEGSYYYLTIPKSGVTGDLSYLTVGQIAVLGYQGTLDENHASLVDISASNMITGIYVEEYAFAIKIINAVRSMDMEALSDLTNFPVFLETGTFSSHIDTSGEFEAISLEKIFSSESVERLSNYNLFDLKYTNAGFVMGEGSPNITFDVDDDGILGIIGMNCTYHIEKEAESKK